MKCSGHGPESGPANPLHVSQISASTSTLEREVSLENSIIHLYRYFNVILSQNVACKTFNRSVQPGSRCEDMIATEDPMDPWRGAFLFHRHMQDLGDSGLCPEKAGCQRTGIGENACNMSGVTWRSYQKVAIRLPSVACLIHCKCKGSAAWSRSVSKGPLMCTNQTRDL